MKENVCSTLNDCKFSGKLFVNFEDTLCPLCLIFLTQRTQSEKHKVHEELAE